MSAREERQKVQEQYGNLFNTLSDIIFRHDPIGINFEDNTDEYDPEVGTILPRLKNAHSEAETLIIIHEEFGRWFGEDIAGSQDKYQDLAVEIWSVWQQFNE